MKRIICLFLVIFSFTFSSAIAADGRVYSLKLGKMYTVGEKIEPGIYSLNFYSKDTILKYAKILVGKDLLLLDTNLVRNGEYKEYEINEDNPQLVFKLSENEKVYVAAGSPRLISEGEDTLDEKTENDKNYLLSSEEVNKIIKSAPYVSSKNITIDSPDGVDFYTYFGSGIIMSGASGDCFKMVECDDEPIVDHYKIMPLKTGKGKIEYVINMKKKIVVNVTVKESAFKEKTVVNSENATTARATKSVNIREKASTDSKKVGSLKKGETVSVITPYYADGWHEISYKNKTCYVSANFVELE